MKAGILVIAALCLTLTACGTDATPAQQPTNQVIAFPAADV